jgi:protein phosphatase-4 regulatory subunit 3
MHAQVVMALQGDAQFLPELFRRLKSAGPGDPEWLDQVAFLQELCSLAKHLQAASRTQLLSKLVGLGLFEVKPTECPLSSLKIVLSALVHRTAA